MLKKSPLFLILATSIQNFYVYVIMLGQDLVGLFHKFCIDTKSEFLHKNKNHIRKSIFTDYEVNIFL